MIRVRGALKNRQKNPIKADGWNHHMEDKREGQRKAKTCAARKNQRRERPSPSCGCGRKLSPPQPL
jgi:hypothetical protein